MLTAPLPAPAAPLTELVSLVRTLAADPALWRPHVRFTASRHWSRLPSPDGVDVWLLTWLPAQGTDLHDHGSSAAALTVLAGQLDEVRATPDGALSRSRLGPGDTHWVAPGVVHDVENVGSTPAVSLHAYSPRLTRMTFWTPTAAGLRAVRTVATDEPELDGTR